LQVTFEEGTWAAWLYDLLKPHVTNLVVCNSRRNALLKEGSKSDRIDALKLAELLRLNSLRPVYHGEHGLRTLKELARSYLTISKDLGRVMSRVTAIYRSWGIPCSSLPPPDAISLSQQAAAMGLQGFAIETHSSADHQCVDESCNARRRRFRFEG
jgi:Transposase